MTDPAFMPSTAAAVTSRGAGRPGHERGGDDHVEARDRLRQRLLLARALVLGELAGVAALPRRLDPRSSHLAPSDSTCSAVSGRTS
jgi:hypothetical protein